MGMRKSFKNFFATKCIYIAFATAMTFSGFAQEEYGIAPYEFNPQVIDSLSDVALVIAKKNVRERPRCFHKISIVKKNKQQTLISSHTLEKEFCFASEKKSFEEPDVNFDGFDDIRIKSSGKENEGHDLFFIRNVKSKKFEFSKILYKMVNVDFLEDKKIVRGVVSCGPKCEELKAFKWAGANLVPFVDKSANKNSPKNIHDELLEKMND